MSKDMLVDDLIIPMEHDADGRDIASAMSAAREALVIEGRDHVAQFIMVLSYGQSTSTSASVAMTLEKAEAINAGIEVAAITIGLEAENEMNGIVTKPEMLFVSADANSLLDLDLQIWRELCEGELNDMKKYPLNFTFIDVFVCFLKKMKYLIVVLCILRSHL